VPVPDTQVRYVPDPVYLIERFDRQTVETETRRLHVIDACQLLGLDRAFKYSAATADNLARCLELCSSQARARQDLFAWVVFNLLTGNADAHLKNLSFLVGPGGFELAPFYDLVSTECYRASLGNQPRWPDTPLSTQIGAATRFAEVTRESVLAFAQQIGLNARAANRRLDEMSERIVAQANDLYEEFSTLAIPQAAIRAGQLKVLRQIRLIVIKEMAVRLNQPSSGPRS